MTLGADYEFKVSGNAGISFEHLLIIFGIITNLSKIKVNNSQLLSIIIIVACTFYSIVQTFWTFNALHLVSFYIS